YAAAHESGAQEGKGEANRVGGVVLRGKDQPFGKNEATISVYRRPELYDRSGAKGEYQLAVPKEIDKYRLVYTAKGYWEQVTPHDLANDHDPEKRDPVTLDKRDSRRNWRLDELRPPPARP